VLLIKDKYKLNVVKFIYKQQNNLLPESFNNYFTKIKENHGHKTRKNENISINLCKTEIGKRATSYQGAIEWNSIPIDIRKAKSLKSFTKKYKRILDKSILID